MPYPNEARHRQLAEQLYVYSQLQHEYGAVGIDALLARAETALAALVSELRALPVDAALAAQEPNDHPGIRQLRPAGPRRLLPQFDQVVYL